MSYLDIIPIGEVEETLLSFLKQSLLQTFNIETRIRHCHFDLSVVYDPLRDQYNSTGLLLQLIQDTPPDTLRILGVTELDLFIPIFTFLFGEAQLKGVGALVSARRLDRRGKGLALMWKAPAMPPNAGSSAWVKLNEDGTVSVGVGGQ